MDWKLYLLSLLSMWLLPMTSSTSGLTFQKSALRMISNRRSRPSPGLKGKNNHLELLFQDNLKEEGQSGLERSLFYNENQIPHLFKSFEDALLNDTEILYRLQQAFFPPEGHMNLVPIPFSVNIYVDKILDTRTITSKSASFNCTSKQGQCLWENVGLEWYPEGSTLAYNDELRQYVSLIHTKLRELDYVSWNVLQRLATFGQNGEYPDITFTLRVKQLEQVPSDEDVSNALLALMTWVKAYARAFEQPIERSDSDKGRVFLLADIKSDIYMESCVLMLFVSLNLLITLSAGVFLKSFSSFAIQKATSLLKEGVKTLSLYWATALVFMVANIGCLIADLFTFETALSDGLDHFFFTKIAVVFFVLITEPFIVFYTTRNFMTILNIPRTVGKTLCCCFSYTYGSRFAHTIAVLNILWFAHRLATAFILILFNIVVYPAETFTTVTLIISVLTVLIFITTYVLHTCSKRRKKIHLRTICIVFCAFTVGLVVLSVVVSFALVYLILLDKGLQTTGVGGFLLSLFPPFLFFTIGLIIQKRFFRKKGKNRDVDSEEVSLSASSTGNLRQIAEYQHQDLTDTDTATSASRKLSVQFSYGYDGLGEGDRLDNSMTNKHQSSVRRKHDGTNSSEGMTLLVPPLARGALYTKST